MGSHLLQATHPRPAPGTKAEPDGASPRQCQDRDKLRGQGVDRRIPSTLGRIRCDPSQRRRVDVSESLSLAVGISCPPGELLPISLVTCDRVGESTAPPPSLVLLGCLKCGEHPDLTGRWEWRGRAPGVSCRSATRGLHVCPHLGRGSHWPLGP